MVSNLDHIERMQRIQEQIRRQERKRFHCLAVVESVATIANSLFDNDFLIL